MRDSGGSLTQNHWPYELTFTGVQETDRQGTNLVSNTAQHVHTMHLKLDQHEETTSLWGMEPMDQEKEEEADEGFGWGEEGEYDWTTPHLLQSHQQIGHKARDSVLPTQIPLNGFRVQRLLRWHKLRKNVNIRACLALHWRTWCQRAKRAGFLGHKHVRRWRRKRHFHSRQIENQPEASQLNGRPQGYVLDEEQIGPAAGMYVVGPDLIRQFPIPFSEHTFCMYCSYMLALTTYMFSLIVLREPFDI